jgi:phosphoglycerate-specific signal transduction histidine kinase
LSLKNDIAGTRHWYQGIAAKLLIAFGLIVALTIGASLLSLIRFGEVESAIRRTTDVSLPLVKLSLTIEAQTGELVASTNELGGSETEVQQFERMEQVSAQIGRLWTLVGELQEISKNGGAARLQEILAKLNGELGAIDRSTREFVVVASRRKAAIERIAVASGKMLAMMQPIADRIGSRLSGLIGAGAQSSAEAATDLNLLRIAYALRADVNRSAELLARAAAAPDVTAMSVITA